MSTWNKKQISKNDIEKLQESYGIDALTASIMVRRGITEGREILYYMEDDLRFQHSPFSFNSMEDAVDRILEAKEENEKILIFGDRDVDGVTATTVLYDCLKSMGIDVQYRLPSGDEAYGLSMDAVNTFAAEYGSLIITVDCGISNNAEVARAGELGLDVIIVDHHNAPQELPEPAIIIDAKVENSGYPFKDISGCAVVYKLVSALRFSKSQWYKEEVAILNIQETEEKDVNVIDVIKLRNLIPVSRITEKVQVPSSIFTTRLPEFLKGVVILVWEKDSQKKLLNSTFGSGADFSLLDMREQIGAFFPQMASLPLSKIKTLSKIAKYGNHAPTEIGGFYNIFVTYVQQSLRKEFPGIAEQEEKDLQLVTLAALADIMPMKNENRLFVRKGLASINAGKIRPGLMELMSELDMLGKRVSSTDLSWVVVSNLNAAGRLGHPEFAAELFLTDDSSKRTEMAHKIIELNTKRKQFSSEGLSLALVNAEKSISEHNGKLCFIVDEKINRGVSGIIAGRLVSQYDVPSIVVTFIDDTAFGSMRSCRKLSSPAFLEQMSDIFLNFGGHDAAAGFSLKKERLEEFKARILELSRTIELEESSAGIFEIDAEIPPSYLTPNLLTVSDRFEPFGEENRSLLFMTRSIPVLDAIVLGKGEKQHLKITVGNDKFKWPALFWNEGERLHRDFEIGDKIDILFHVERNTFNGVETPQLILSDLKRSY